MTMLAIVKVNKSIELLSLIDSSIYHGMFKKTVNGIALIILFDPTSIRWKTRPQANQYSIGQNKITILTFASEE